MDLMLLKIWHLNQPPSCPRSFGNTTFSLIYVASENNDQRFSSSNCLLCIVDVTFLVYLIVVAVVVNDDNDDEDDDDVVSVLSF